MAKSIDVVAVLKQQNTYLQVIIALLARGNGEPAEAILSEFGFGPQAIAEFVDKKPDAVRMLVKRYKQQKNNK